LQYARLEHVIPLKQLWTNFEKEKNIEIDCNSLNFKKNSGISLAWKNYHKANAKLRVICKDCEKVTQKKLPSQSLGLSK
jgi:hypothetical protein